MDIEYLVEKYSKLVYKISYNMLASSLDAEDAVQEVYINLYKTKDRYADLTENEIKNLICKIALNKCKDILKSNIKKIDNLTTKDIFTLENLAAENKIEEEIELKESKQRVAKHIKELREPYSSILTYYYINEYSLDEVASILKVPKPTLKTQISRAKKLLKEKINSEEGGNLHE
ncbi:MAG: sigma-70 family RNA polymerase sigma factor [Clostridia bacterium]